MMKEERFIQVKSIMKKLDVLNCRMYAYSEEDEDFLENVVFGIANTMPKIWNYKEGNRAQCYSNMYSKLLLTYLLSEIKEGNLLTMNFLDRITKDSLEIWMEFDDDYKGYQMSSVLEHIVEEVITFFGVFEIHSLYVDTLEIYEAHHMKMEAPEVVKKCLVDAMPILDNYIDINKDTYQLINLDWVAGNNYEFEIELEVIESKLLYEIYKKELQEITEEGTLIIKTCKECMLNILQEDFINEDLQWEIIAHEECMIKYCGVTCSELIGDNWQHSMEICDRIHKYKYQNLFMFIELQKWMLDYKEKYLR